MGVGEKAVHCCCELGVRTVPATTPDAADSHVNTGVKPTSPALTSCSNVDAILVGVLSRGRIHHTE